jgi:hypothetical protein
MAANDNITRLREAGILAVDWNPSVADTTALESLTAAEVDAIIAVKQKLGEAFFQAHMQPRADFIF